METEEYKNHTIEIHQDEIPESPREWDNLGTMVCWHNRYLLGDEQPNIEPERFFEDLGEEVFRLNLYLYDHSGITMNTSGFSCPWDSGQVGWIYVTKERVRKEYSVKRISKKIRERVFNLLRSEVKTYDDYLTGNVYGYSVKDLNDEFVDGCSGYYGQEGVLEAIRAAKSFIDYKIGRAHV